MQDERILVEGSAYRSLEPGVATLGMLVMELDSNPQAAFERCGPKVNEVVAQLRVLVGDDGRVTTGGLRVERHWDPEEEDGQRLHAASGPISVECTPELAAQVFSRAIALGVDEVHGPRYSLRDPSPVLEDLLGEAVVAARRKAQRLAQAAERSLGDIVAIKERFGDGWENGGVRVMAASASPEPADVDLQPAHVTLTATVHVTFAIGYCDGAGT